MQTNDSDGSSEQDKLHKISDWVYLGKDFISLSSALADGYPLIFGFKCGKNLSNLQRGEIYCPPPDNFRSDDGTIPDGHFAVLVGAQQERRLKFFYFLNSWDEDFCQRDDNEGDGIRGGVGAIINDGIQLPIQVLRFNER